MNVRAADSSVAAGAVARRSLQFNLDTRDRWVAFTGHRQRLMAIISGCSPGGRLAVLGAGNANDLALPRLLEQFDEVDLIDLDGDALEFGVQGQHASSPRLRLHAPVDVSGFLDLLEGWATRVPSARDLDDGLRRIGGPSNAVIPGAPFDVVVATCVLTQLIDACVTALGADHPRLPELVLAVRDRHLRTLVTSTAPGGQAILVTDLVSSDTVPDLAAVPDDRIADVAATCIANGNFFTGANPFAVRAALETNPTVAASVTDVRLHVPWRWDLGQRSYIVFALSMRRPGQTLSPLMPSP